MARSSVATRQSQASAHSQPPPTQAPWIAATVGMRQRSQRGEDVLAQRDELLQLRAGSSTASARRSAPAMKMDGLRLSRISPSRPKSGCAERTHVGAEFLQRVAVEDIRRRIRPVEKQDAEPSSRSCRWMFCMSF